MPLNTSDGTSSRTGQCLCGTIKYSLTGPSTKPYYNTICHCLKCRRVTDVFRHGAHASVMRHLLFQPLRFHAVVA
ncbi:hypothetical protein BST61_g3657 [Cercospora zeina]